jgi:cytochrome c553
MKGTTMLWALPAFALVAAVSGTSRADEATRHVIARQDLEAKIHYCKDCHGQLGQGFRGSYPVPRLAGQSVEYLESKFEVITEHKQDNATAETFMVPVLGSVDPMIRRAVASHFNGLDPAPVGGAPKELIPEGKKIYEAGIPEANVPACVSCHGPDAKGVGATPRLAGQIYPFTIKVLTNWAKERGKTGIALNEHRLTDNQTSEVAAYLSEVR